MNKNNNVNASAGGVTFTGLLTLIFITLKLLGVITWRWLWVLSPLWISFVIGIVVLIIAFAIALRK